MKKEKTDVKMPAYLKRQMFKCLKIQLFRHLAVFLAIFVVSSCAYYGRFDPETIKSDFQLIFKKTRVVEVKPSEIPGIYEIYYEGDHPGIIYYYPDKKILIFGEFWSINGTSFTGEKLEKLLIKKIENKREKETEDGRSEGEENRDSDS